MTDHDKAAPAGPWRVAFAVPEWRPLQEAARGAPADAAYLLLKDIAAGLTDRGHRLTYVAQRALGDDVCSSHLEHPAPARRTWSGSRWFDVLSRSAWRLQRLLGVPYLNVFSNYRLYDVCLRCLPGHDLVYERNGVYRMGVAKACRALGLPYVLFVDADEILELDYLGTPLTGWLRWRARRTFAYNLRAASAIVCVSEAARDHLVRHWHVAADRVAVLANGVDIDRFRPAPEARTRRRAALGYDSQPIVLFVGSFYEWHDVPSVVAAFARVLRVRPEARLLLVGDGATRQAIQQQIADLRLDHAVRFTGRVPQGEVPALIEAADVTVVPYPAMPQAMWLSPMKLFEYMACGKAVVASATGQILQVIQDGTNGLLVAPGDVTALAVAIQRLVEDADLRERLGRQARHDAVEAHSWPHYVTRLEGVFAAAIGGQPVSRP